MSSIPEYALAQARAEKQATVRLPAAHGEPAIAAAEALVEGRTEAGHPPGTSFDLGRAVRRAAPFAVVLFFGLVACKGGSEGVGATPPATTPSISSRRSAGAVAGAEPVQDGSALAAAIRLRADVAALEKRVERLDPDAYAVPAGLGAAAACDVLGVKTATFLPGEARFTCNRLPAVKAYAKVHPNRANRAQAARLETVAGPEARVAMAEGSAP